MDKTIEQRVTKWINEVFVDQNWEKFELEFPNYDITGGSIADMIQVKVIAERAGTERIFDLIIKKSKDSNIVQDTLNLNRAYLNEINMYSKFVPYLRQFAEERNSEPFDLLPNCYGTIAKEGEYVIIMDNLKSKGFKMREVELSHDVHHTKLVIEAYAKWHALCLALRDQKPNVFEEFKNCCKSYLDVDSKMFQYLIATVRKELESVSQIYLDKNDAQTAEKLKLLIIKYKELFEDRINNKNEQYLIIGHGDCWNNNYLFRYNEVEKNPDKVAVIDWQFGSCGSPLTDVTSYIFSCCSISEIERIDEILEFYYGTLSKKLRELKSDPEKCFPWDICQKSFRRYAPIGIAGMPVFVKVSCTVKSNCSYDIAQATEEGDFSNIFEGKLRDPEDYFNKIDGILKFCIKGNYI